MSERYKCKFCEKDYASMSARSNHVKKYHTQDVDKMYTNGIHSGIQSVYNSLTSDTSKQNNLCKYCNKKLSNRNSRWRHEKICKGDNLLEKKEITQIQKASNIQNNIDNKQIVINNFGSNNLEHLSDKFKINLLKHFIIEEEYIEPIPKLIKNINFNPNHKENNNIKITSLRSKIGYKYEDKKWVAVKKHELLKDIIKMGDTILEKIVEERKHIPQNIQEGFDDYQAVKDSLEDLIIKEIEMICYLHFKNLDNELDL